MTAHPVPVVAFVNENKLHAADGAADPERGVLLQRWLDAGVEPGNHGYSHLDLHATPLDQFEADVVRGDAITRQLAGVRGRPLRFFRHPFLHTGRDLETRAQFERFLTARGYRVAPVTIDNDEYIFAGAYDRALARGARDAAARVADAYVPYMEAKVAYFERNARDLFGRDIRQTLLVHANMLTRIASAISPRCSSGAATGSSRSTARSTIRPTSRRIRMSVAAASGGCIAGR